MEEVRSPGACPALSLLFPSHREVSILVPSRASCPGISPCHGPQSNRPAGHGVKP